MAKRLTDNGKWNRKTFRQLSPSMKLAWLYLCDACDNCGIWHPDFELLSFQVGLQITEEEFLASFGGKLVHLANGAFFIPAFIEFQYGLPLSEKVNAHKPVLKALERLGLAKYLVPSSVSGTDAEGMGIPSGTDAEGMGIPSGTDAEGIPNDSLSHKDKNKNKNMDLDLDLDQNRKWKISQATVPLRNTGELCQVRSNPGNGETVCGVHAGNEVCVLEKRGSPEQLQALQERMS